MTPERRELLELESRRPVMEVEAQFLLFLKSRGLRPSQTEFMRWFRRYRQDRGHITMKALDAIFQLVYVEPLSETLNRPSILLRWLEKENE